MVAKWPQVSLPAKVCKLCKGKGTLFSEGKGDYFSKGKGEHFSKGKGDHFFEGKGIVFLEGEGIFSVRLVFLLLVFKFQIFLGGQRPPICEG